MYVDEPTVEETIEILKGLRPRYEAHHKVKITDEALDAAARLSHRYIADRFLPDKAIDLIDEAASKHVIDAQSMTPELRDMKHAPGRARTPRSKRRPRARTTRRRRACARMSCS